MKPTEFFNDWSPRDRELAKALIVHERSSCEGCGLPKHETYQSDREGWYDAEQVICVACRAIEEAASGVDDPEPGGKWRVSLNPGYWEKRNRRRSH